MEERTCRICGCTEDNACEGGCSWVEEDLCSACVKTDDDNDTVELALEKNVVQTKLIKVYTNAIEKIKDEMVKEEKNQYVQYIGAFMINYLNKNPNISEKILNENKSIKGSLNHMEAEARKVRTGNMAMLTPEQGMKTVMDYFEIKDGSHIIMNASQEVKEKRNLTINLDDLL